ncbi:hypothetical protein M3J09_009715 [Ascochyta lentis]
MLTRRDARHAIPVAIRIVWSSGVCKVSVVSDVLGNASSSRSSSPPLFHNPTHPHPRLYHSNPRSKLHHHTFSSPAPCPSPLHLFHNITLHILTQPPHQSTPRLTHRLAHIRTFETKQTHCLPFGSADLDRGQLRV